uniref:Uncharacterized protein n=1 Tax=Equus asinus asinus TaxID=83772 RepID=A0A8C4MA98_EQUAS
MSVFGFSRNPPQALPPQLPFCFGRGEDKDSHFFPSPALLSEGPLTFVGHPGPRGFQERGCRLPWRPWGRLDLSGEAEGELRANQIYIQVKLVRLIIKGYPGGRGRIPERK